jgi:hypothetical protein
MDILRSVLKIKEYKSEREYWFSGTVEELRGLQ